MAVQELTKPSTIPSQPERWYPPPQGEWTYEDYLHLPDDGMRYEVVKGDLYMSPAPSPKHQIVLGNLFTKFNTHVSAQDLGLVVFAPIDVVLREVRASVQPDLIYIAKENLSIVTETKIEGIPNIVVEVLSPGSLVNDRKTKFNAYAAAGIPEYWLVDVVSCKIEVNVLRGRAYAPLGHFSGDEEAVSEVLQGLKIKVSDICQ